MDFEIYHIFRSVIGEVSFGLKNYFIFHKDVIILFNVMPGMALETHILFTAMSEMAPETHILLTIMSGMALETHQVSCQMSNF
jgi:hypothetical protein